MVGNPKQASPDDETSSITCNLNGDTLYVGGNGPGNYSKIQDAIDNATNGDTVYVYNGTYAEGVIVDKTINLVGEDRNTTIIDSTNINDHTVHITLGADGVTLSGFTIKNDEIDPYAISVYICSDNNIITHNIINNREGIIMEEYSSRNIISNNIINAWIHGIMLEYSNDNIISTNTITNTTDGAIDLLYSLNNSITENILVDNKFGIFLILFSHDNIISGNIISNEFTGISCSKCDRNTISKNIISNNSDWGIRIDLSLNNNVSRNHIINNGKGISIAYSLKNNIYENNFIDNEKEASWQYTVLEYVLFPFRNKWERNYWDGSRKFPKPIFGMLYFGAIGNLPLLMPCFQFDWHPAQEPYEVK
jgi:parallel beta-helix repeat protein